MRIPLKYHCTDRKYRIPRIWSNRELARFSHLFSGNVINVSGWKDEDKEGRRYKDYFCNATEYYVSNVAGYRGWSQLDNEIYLDLERDLPKELEGKFEVAFCHTALEHVSRVEKAFDNLCNLSSDVLIIVVPFVQDQHASPDYGDYWRFTPEGVEESLKQRGFEVLYLSTTPYKNAAIYVFAIGSRNPERWQEYIRGVRGSEGRLDWIKTPLYCRALALIKILAKRLT